MVESMLVAVTRISTFAGDAGLTNATGFFFAREGRMFLITNRHVVREETTDHRPDRIEIELHTDPENVAEVVAHSIPLYNGEAPLWREAVDDAGTVDVIAIELETSALPPVMLFQAFGPEHLLDQMDKVEVGAPLLIVGFPLNFQDTLHHLPVGRQAIVSSAFGLRFQGQGYFLTDGRMHRGTSGAPVVTRMRREAGRESFPWTLLGVHASRLDVGRDKQQDEALGLNCAWYADVIMTLTEDLPEGDGQTAAPATAEAGSSPKRSGNERSTARRSHSLPAAKAKPAAATQPAPPAEAPLAPQT